MDPEIMQLLMECRQILAEMKVSTQRFAEQYQEYKQSETKMEVSEEDLLSESSIDEQEMKMEMDVVPDNPSESSIEEEERKMEVPKSLILHQTSITSPLPTQSPLPHFFSEVQTSNQIISPLTPMSHTITEIVISCSLSLSSESHLLLLNRPVAEMMTPLRLPRHHFPDFVLIWNMLTDFLSEQWSLLPFEYWIEGILLVEPSATLSIPYNSSFYLSSFPSDQPSFSLLPFLLGKLSWKSTSMVTVISTSLFSKRLNTASWLNMPPWLHHFPSFTKCLSSIWQSKDRYIWVDLAASPVDYGPGLSGDGLLLRGEFHLLAAFNGKPKLEKEVLADLAPMEYGAYQVHLVPSLRIPVLVDISRKNGSIVAYLGVFHENSRIVLDVKLGFMKSDLHACNAVLEGCCFNLEPVKVAERVIELMLLLGVSLNDMKGNFQVHLNVFGMVFTFYKALGYSVGSSVVEEDKLELANSLGEKAKSPGVALLLPTDVVIANKFADVDSKVVPASAIPDGWIGLDVGPDSTKIFSEALDKTQTIIWNGPMGVLEFDKFAVGTETIAKKLAELSGKGVKTIIGVGDSVATVGKVGLADKMSHISTGGGASLELIGQFNILDLHKSFPSDRYLLLVLESTRVEIAVLLNELAYIKYEATSSNSEAFPLKIQKLAIMFALVESIIKLISNLCEYEGGIMHHMHHIIIENTFTKVISGLDETVVVILEFLKDAKDHGQKKGDDVLACVQLVRSCLAELLRYLLSVENENEHANKHAPIDVQLVLGLAALPWKKATEEQDAHASWFNNSSLGWRVNKASAHSLEKDTFISRGVITHFGFDPGGILLATALKLTLFDQTKQVCDVVQATFLKSMLSYRKFMVFIEKVYLSCLDSCHPLSRTSSSFTSHQMILFSCRMNLKIFLLISLLWCDISFIDNLFSVLAFIECSAYMVKYRLEGKSFEGGRFVVGYSYK